MSANQFNITDVQQRLYAGDEAALKSLYVYYGNRLFQFAMALLRSKEMAEEAVSDTFLKLWQKREQLGRIENLPFYLYVMTKNSCLDYLRKFGNSKNLNLDDISLPFYKVEATPEDLMITAEVLQQINKAENELPVRCRLIFRLVKEDGLKYREVAELLQVNIKTVENQIGIALKKIHAAVNVLLPRSLK